MSEDPQLHVQFLQRPTYAFLQTVGYGSQGKTELHLHELFGQRVVSKTISLLGVPGGIASSEPRLLKDIEHPRIVRVREAQWAAGHDPSLKVVTFTTDFCEGLSVAAALDTGHRFSVSAALRITADVLDALDHLHNTHQIVHRDVKPGNVMLDGERGRGYLGDFGSAALLDASGVVPAGGCTELYQAPESIVGSITTAADVYGAGMVALELLHGAPNFELLDHDKISKRLAEGRRALSDPYFAPMPWVPPAVASIVRAMTQKDPARRPTPAEALRLINRTPCVSWKRVEGTGLVGRWEGRWPPTVSRDRQRVYRVTSTPIEAGRHRGLLRLQAAWRAPSTTWKNYARFARRIDPDDDAALARMFRDVEAAAQSAPAR